VEVPIVDGDANMMFAQGSIAKDLDGRLLGVRCSVCRRLMTVTLYEVRTGKAVPCPNCEAWMPLWDLEGTFQALHELALLVDDQVGVTVK
jgi:hypothetical protein